MSIKEIKVTYEPSGSFFTIATHIQETVVPENKLWSLLHQFFKDGVPGYSSTSNALTQVFYLCGPYNSGSWHDKFLTTLINVCERLEIIRDPAYSRKLICQYVDHVMACINDTVVLDAYTGIKTEPDEKFMSDMEKHLDVPLGATKDWRHIIASFIAHAINRGIPVSSNEQLVKMANNKVEDDVVSVLNSV